MRSRELQGKATRWVTLGVLSAALTANGMLLGAGGMFIRGDSNSDQKVDIADSIFSLGFLFTGGREPPCPDAADANDDSRVDISDAVWTLNYLFLGEAAPPLPYPAPGTDPTSDALTCLETSGTLLVAIHDTAPESLTEFWLSLTKVEARTSGGEDVTLFPPASDPGATKQVNLLDLTSASSVLASVEVPAGEYARVHLEFDSAFARAGADDVTVVPDHGEVDLALASPVTVLEGNLSSLVVDFDLTLSLTDGGPGKVLLEPAVVEDDASSDIDVAEFRGTVSAVDVEGGTFEVDVTTEQDDGADVPVGRLVVKVDGATSFEDAAGLGDLSAGAIVEVDGVLHDDGIFLASSVELKTAEEGEDLNDDGIPDSDEDPTHDTDIDNDDDPNTEDADDDGDGIDDSQDMDDDNDGLTDDSDDDDDGDGVSDDMDDDDDGDGLDDSDESDADHDGVSDDSDRDDDDDGVDDSQDQDDDGDGKVDSSERDSDGDGVRDDHDSDDDGDGVDDSADTDDDGDGIHDDDEPDQDEDGISDEDDHDVDGDGSNNEQDSDDDGDGAVDSSERDSDGDGISDDHDSDDDGDGIDDSADDDSDGDGISDDSEDDLDGDGTPDDEDTDIDGDGTNNEHDADDDGDGALDDSDNCVTVPNADQEDKDGDGIGDACEDDGGEDL